MFNLDINLELYKIFYYVAKNMNITKASEELMVSQPAITQHIKKLEELLNVTLFVRSKKGVTLTKDGEYIYNKIKDNILIFESISNHFYNLNNLNIGDLKIGTDTSNLNVAIMKYLRTLKDEYPNISIKIIRDDAASLINMLEDNVLDIAVLNDCEIPKSINHIKDIYIEEEFVCSASLYDKYKGITIDEENLQELPLILMGNKSTTRKNFNKYCLKNNLVIKPKYEFDSYSLAVDFIKNGFGIGIVNKNYIKNDLANGNLFILNTNLVMDKRRVMILSSNNKSKINELFIKMIENDESGI